MKHDPSDVSELADHLRNFMIGDGWTNIRSARGLAFFSPPESLGIRGKYTIALPEDSNKSNVISLIHEATSALLQIYGYTNIGALVNRSVALSSGDEPTRIVSRFLDDKTQMGAMPLASVVAFATKLEESLYRSAKFKLEPASKSEDLIAKQFAQGCLFLQTSVGSFITKVEVPSGVLRQKSLFGDEAVYSGEVVSSLFAAIRFLNEKILGVEDPFQENEELFQSNEVLSNAISLFDVEFLRAISDALLLPNMNEIEFSIEFGSKSQMTSTGSLSVKKRNRLKEFVEFIKEKLRGESNIDVTGAIVELRSKDPSGDKNYIKVAADFHGDRTFISATLTQSQYALALDAHRHKRKVRLVGDGLRLATHIRIEKLNSFE